MGFFRSWALKMDIDQRKREALTAFNHATTEVLFLESKVGQGLATPERLGRAREQQRELRKHLSEEFGIENP